MTVSLPLLLFLLLQAGATGRASLVGQVVAAGTEAPVPHARLVVAKVGGDVSDYRTTVADESGRFAVRDLATGSYRIHAERQGYLRGEYGRRTPNVAGTPISLADSQATAPITITMVQTGVITGRVQDEGRPARNVWVRAMASRFFDGERSLAIVAYARTNDLGEYRVFDLAPGSYVVSAMPQDRPRLDGDTYVVPSIPSIANGNRSEIRTSGAEALAASLIDATAFDQTVVIPIYYPGTTDSGAATSIDVTAGATIPEINLTIAHAATQRIRGRVIDGVTRQPAAAVTVSLAARDERRAVSRPSLRTTTGDFEFAGVAHGRYALEAQTGGPGGLVGKATIEVTSNDVEGIEIVIYPETTVRGRLTILGAAVAPDAYLSVQLIGADGIGGYSAVRVQSDGRFAVERVEARDYRVRIVARGRFLAPESVRLGANEYERRPFRVGPEMAEIPLEVVVNVAVGTLDVAVVDANQRPVSGTTVALVPELPRRNESSRYRSLTTDVNGRIHVEDVIPGDYRLFVEDVDPAAWQDPDVLRRYEARGTRVTVAEGTPRSVTVRVPR
jgi:Carboxypeptidase regulatory-like domain